MLHHADLEAVLVPHSKVLGPYADRLYVNVLPVGMEIVPAAAYLDGSTLFDSLSQAAERWHAPDLCVTASLWNKYYNAAVVPGILAAMTLGGIGWDGALERAAIAVQDELPRALVVSGDDKVVYQPRLPLEQANDDLGRRVETLPELYQFVVSGLFERHVGLVIKQLHELTRVSRQILWSNVANLCADLYDRLLQSPSVAAVAYADRALLLEQVELPGLSGFNPMCGAVWYEHGERTSARVRRRCCLRYRLPHSTPCAVCPLLRSAEHDQTSNIGISRSSRCGTW